MYNIVVFSGGTGSIAIQEGFSAIYGNDNYNLDIVMLMIMESRQAFAEKYSILKSLALAI